MKLELKYQAIFLRKKGKTYKEIQTILGPLAKGTLSSWLKPIELTAGQKKRILKKTLNRAEAGRQKGGWTNHQKRLTRIANIQKIAEQEFPKMLKNPIFLPGLALYMAEGSKKSEIFQFMNSDSSLINLLIKWIVEIGGLPASAIKLRLYLHHIYASEKCEVYWSQTTNIPLSQFYKSVYKSTAHLRKKNPQYKGCLRVEVGGSELFWKTMQWSKMMYSHLKV